MNDKPIVIMLTVYPPKKAVRKVLVSGAPAGEMPVLMGGTFQDRHALLDAVYVAVLKRDPQVVTIKETTKPAKKSAKAVVDSDGGDEEATVEMQAAENGDQLDSEDLPKIEGDDAPNSDEAEKFEAQLSDISLPEETESDEVGNG